MPLCLSAIAGIPAGFQTDGAIQAKTNGGGPSGPKELQPWVADEAPSDQLVTLDSAVSTPDARWLLCELCFVSALLYVSVSLSDGWTDGGGVCTRLLFLAKCAFNPL